MHDVALAPAFEATVLLSTSAALAIGAWLAVRHHTTSDESSPRSGEAHSRGARGAEPLERDEPTARPPQRGPLLVLACHPLVQLLVVCALLYANQVLFGAHVLRAHGGSSAFIGRYIGAGWFAIGTQDPLVQLAARHVGDGQWLSPTVLRVQAFLELPFTLFAYLAVARLLGRGVHRTLCRMPLLALASLSFSFTFSLVELSVPNPFTRDDLFLRAIACLVVPVYVAWIARLEDASSGRASEDGPRGVLGLLAFLAGAGAIAYVVLAVYDAFLLYNLAHLPRYAGGLVVALVVAVLASVAAPRVDVALARSRDGVVPALATSMDATVSALRAFTVLFFVPSLSLRYWGEHVSAALAGALLVMLGAIAGAALALLRARRAARPFAGELARFAVAGGCALAAGGWAAQVVLLRGAHAVMPELLLARMALSFLAVAIVVFRGVEIAVCWRVHETKAQADEA